MTPMGILDIPAPALTWLDTNAGAILPPPWRLILWGAAAGLISMIMYRQLSSQERIRSGKIAIMAARHRLMAFDGDFGDAWPLMRALLHLSLRQVARVLWPALAASLPLLFMLNWLSTAYGYAYPAAGAALQIHTAPQAYTARWHEDRGLPRIVIVDDADRPLVDVRLEAPVPVIHKWYWWNLIAGNPAGYLPAAAGVDRITASLPRKHYLTFGPEWIRSWESLFFISLLGVSLALKVKLRIV